MTTTTNNSWVRWILTAIGVATIACLATIALVQSYYFDRAVREARSLSKSAIVEIKSITDAHTGARAEQFKSVESKLDRILLALPEKR